MRAASSTKPADAAWRECQPASAGLVRAARGFIPRARRRNLRHTHTGLGVVKRLEDTMLPGSQALQTRALPDHGADKPRKEGRMSQSVRAKVRIADKWWVTIAVTLGMLMSIM